jgi:uncharacterized protein with PIN domain
MADLSEYTTLEKKAFDGAECQSGWPVNCAVLHIMAEHGMVSNKEISDATLKYKFDELIQKETVLSKSAKNENADWQIACKHCGLSRPLDILESNSESYDKETGLSAPMNMTVSKSGSQRRKEDARTEMERVADAFGFTLRRIEEATRLFNLFHEYGSGSGGRGHKVTAVAALRVASLNAGMPVPVAKLAKAHSEKPSVKVVNRFLSDARANNLFDINRLDAVEIVSHLASKIETPPEMLKEALEIAKETVPNIRAVDHACAALMLAASKEAKTRPRRFSGAAIARVAMIDRKGVYRAAEALRNLNRPLVLVNPQQAENKMIPSTVVKQLRRIRRQ